MTERQQRVRTRRTVGRGWLRNSLPAYTPGSGAASPEDSLQKETKDLNQYPPDWPEIADRIKQAAGWCCERCKHPHDVTTGHVLTVHHLDGQKSNCADWNMAALCQRCHLSIQGRVKMDQLFFAEILDVSEWFRPHLEGYQMNGISQKRTKAMKAPHGPSIRPSLSSLPSVKNK